MGAIVGGVCVVLAAPRAFACEACNQRMIASLLGADGTTPSRHADEMRGLMAFNGLASRVAPATALNPVLAATIAAAAPAKSAAPAAKSAAPAAVTPHPFADIIERDRKLPIPATSYVVPGTKPDKKFTLIMEEGDVPPDEGNYLIVTHSFGSATRGAIGVLAAAKDQQRTPAVIATGPSYAKADLENLTAKAVRIIAPTAPATDDLANPARPPRRNHDAREHHRKLFLAESGRGARGHDGRMDQRGRVHLRPARQRLLRARCSPGDVLPAA